MRIHPVEGYFLVKNYRRSLTKGQRKGVLEITRTWSKLSEFFIFSYVGFCIAAPLAPSVVGVTDVKFDFDWTNKIKCPNPNETKISQLHIK